MKALVLIIGIALILGLGALWLNAMPQPHHAAIPAAPLLVSSTAGAGIATATPAVLPAVRLPVAAMLATPTVGTATATPNLIPAGTSTQVTVTIQIIDPTLIPGSVNLLRLGATGTQPIILGVMHDDGQNGDAVAGDQIYTLQVPFNEATAGQVQLQVSAAFKGLLKRVLSSIVTLSIWNTFSNSTLGVQFLIPQTMTGTPIANAAALSIYVHDISEELPSGGITITKSSQNLAAILARISTTLTLSTQTTLMFNGHPWLINTYTDSTSGQQFIDAFAVVNGNVYQVGGLGNASVTNILPTVLSTFRFL